MKNTFQRLVMFMASMAMYACGENRDMINDNIKEPGHNQGALTPLKLATTDITVTVTTQGSINQRTMLALTGQFNDNPPSSHNTLTPGFVFIQPGAAIDHDALAKELAQATLDKGFSKTSTHLVYLEEKPLDDKTTTLWKSMAFDEQGLLAANQHYQVVGFVKNKAHVWLGEYPVDYNTPHTLPQTPSVTDIENKVDYTMKPFESKFTLLNGETTHNVEKRHEVHFLFIQQGASYTPACICQEKIADKKVWSNNDFEQLHGKEVVTFKVDKIQKQGGGSLVKVTKKEAANDLFALGTTYNVYLVVYAPSPADKPTVDAMYYSKTKPVFIPMPIKPIITKAEIQQLIDWKGHGGDNGAIQSIQLRLAGEVDNAGKDPPTLLRRFFTLHKTPLAQALTNQPCLVQINLVFTMVKMLCFN